MPNSVLSDYAVGTQTLDRDSPLPLYHQLKQALRSKLENGEWGPGDRIPTEDELSQRYQISKITVRHAIGRLVDEGLLYRQQGKGTFVAKPKIEQGPLVLMSFSEQMQQWGLRPGSVLLKREVVPAGMKVAKELQVEEGTLVSEIQRLRLADDEPMGIQTSSIPLGRCPQLLEEGELQSLYSILEKYGARPVAAVERYEATLIQEFEASLLRVRVGSPAFLVERVAYDGNGQAIEFVRSIMRGDRYVVTVALQAGRSEPSTPAQ